MVGIADIPTAFVYYFLENQKNLLAKKPSQTLQSGIGTRES
jgi:hypothetical protein